MLLTAGRTSSQAERRRGGEAVWQSGSQAVLLVLAQLCLQSKIREVQFHQHLELRVARRLIRAKT